MSKMTLDLMNKKTRLQPPSLVRLWPPGKAVIEFFIHLGLKTCKPVDRPLILCCLFFFGKQQPEREVVCVGCLRTTQGQLTL